MSLKDNKTNYYKPCLTEISLEDEYYIKLKNGKYSKNTILGTDHLLKVLLDIDNIYCKYLDQEDIEDLGWKIKYNREDQFDLPDIENNEIQGYYQFNYNNRELQFIYNSYSYDCLFQGKIKNKNELKRLMIQLDIKKS